MCQADTYSPGRSYQVQRRGNWALRTWEVELLRHRIRKTQQGMWSAAHQHYSPCRPLLATEKLGPVLFASWRGWVPCVWVWKSNFIPGSGSHQKWRASCSDVEDFRRLAFFGNWEWRDGKGEWMWGAKEDRAWWWVTPGSGGHMPQEERLWLQHKAPS